MTNPSLTFGVALLDPNNPNNTGAGSGGFFANGFAITTSDTVNFTHQTSAVWVGGAGNLVAIMNGVPVTFTAVAAGTLLPIQATRVNATNTTASNLVGLY